MENEEFRIFHFGHFQMSSIQQGIQASHSQTEMALKYAVMTGTTGSDHVASEQIKMYFEWARNHKTMICKNGGNSTDLKRISDVVNRHDASFPCAEFYESEDAFEGVLTNVAIVLPERIFAEGVSVARSTTGNKVKIGAHTYYSYKAPNMHKEYTYTEYENELIQVLISTRLAS